MGSGPQDHDEADVRAGDDSYAVWAPDSRWINFSAFLASGQGDRLFALEKDRLGTVGRGFDISPDGQRFLMVVPVGTDDAERESLTVVTHWLDELTARVKAK